jgi:cytochrome c-type biogenesis protein CcmF
MAWKRGNFYWVAQRLYIAAGIALLAGLISAYVHQGGPLLAPLMVAIAAFVIVGAFAELAERTQIFRVPASESLRRAAGLPRSSWGASDSRSSLRERVLC